MTLDMPRHKLRTPSPVAILYVPCSTPLYTADGVGLMICIRVYSGEC
jgi:hypothetical protein